MRENKNIHSLYSCLLIWILLNAVSNSTTWAQSGFNPEVPPEPGQLSVILQSNPEGAAILSQTNPNGIYTFGTEVTIKAIASSDYEFVAWKQGEKIVSTQAEYTFILNSTTRLTACMRFNPTNNPNEPGSASYHVIATSSPQNGGYIAQSGEGIYSAGEEVTLTAYPYPDYLFDHWEIQGVIASKESVYKFTMPAKHTYLQAVYKWSPDSPGEPGAQEGLLYLYNSDEETGYISQSGNGVYPLGTFVTLTASPFQGYRFTGWFEDGLLLSSSNPYPIKITQKVTTIEARFEKTEESTTPPIEISAAPDNPGEEPHGEVEISGIVKPGQWIEVTAIPNKGYAFEGWYLNGVFIEEAEKEYRLLVKRNTGSLIAKFKELPFDIDADGGNIQWTDVSRFRNNIAYLVAQNISGYQFIGWFWGETLLSKENVYNFNVSLLRSSIPVITAKYTNNVVGNETINTPDKYKLCIRNGQLHIQAATSAYKLAIYTFGGNNLECPRCIPENSTVSIPVPKIPLLIRIESKSGEIYTYKIR